jgi:hypothetical protein
MLCISVHLRGSDSQGSRTQAMVSNIFPSQLVVQDVVPCQGRGE